MTKTKNIFIIVALIGIAVGGFTLTKWLTRNTKRVKGGVIRKNTFDTPPSPIEFEQE